MEYAFAEYFGVGPKVYLRALRLNAVRRALHQADPTEKVADFANRSGFWHMGQFAADYRKYFGELPSETLARSETPIVQVARSRIAASTSSKASPAPGASTSSPPDKKSGVGQATVPVPVISLRAAS